jgi:hypothetical protein
MKKFKFFKIGRLDSSGLEEYLLEAFNSEDIGERYSLLLKINNKNKKEIVSYIDNYIQTEFIQYNQINGKWVKEDCDIIKIDNTTVSELKSIFGSKKRQFVICNDINLLNENCKNIIKDLLEFRKYKNEIIMNDNTNLLCLYYE